jgi:hypothetical protein
MQRDFDRVGLLDEAVIRRVADALGADIIVEGRLVEMDVDLQRDSFGQAAIAFVGLDRGIGGIAWTSFAGAKSVKVDTRFERSFVEQSIGFGSGMEQRGEQSVQENRVKIADALGSVVQDAIAHVSPKMPKQIQNNPAARTGAGDATKPASNQSAAPVAKAPVVAPQASSDSCDALCDHVAKLGATHISPGLCLRKCSDESSSGAKFRVCAGDAKTKDELLQCR